MEFCYDQLEAGDFWDSSYLIDEPDALMICKDEDWTSPCRQVVSVDHCGRASSVVPEEQVPFRESESVVLRDRLMTDAALGGPKPIKAEHSYSLLVCSSPPSSTRSSGVSNLVCPTTSISTRYSQKSVSSKTSCCGGSSTSTSTSCTSSSSSSRSSSSREVYSHHHHQHHHTHGHIDDMEEECYPAISMNTASGRDSKDCAIELNDEEDDDDEDNINTRELSDNKTVLIKGEPLSPVDTLRLQSDDEDEELEEDTKGRIITAISPHSLHLSSALSPTQDEEDEDEELEEEGNKVVVLREFKVEAFEDEEDEELEEEEEEEEDVDMQEGNQMIVTTSQLIDVTIHDSQQHQELLPPTPPSSASSDSEGTVSASCSPERRDNHNNNNNSGNIQSLRGFLQHQPRLYVTGSANANSNSNNSQTASSTRQPIHTPLISCQPKGSTGVLMLTEEEKRTLIAEGYPVPTRLPLSKQEEKSLKKVRRKIKNKISAQESRRKKKEYMDGLERRVSVLSNENSSYKDKVSTLESTNRQLLKELQRLQALVQLQQQSS